MPLPILESQFGIGANGSEAGASGNTDVCGIEWGDIGVRGIEPLSAEDADRVHVQCPVEVPQVQYK